VSGPTPGPWTAHTHGGCFYVFAPGSAMVADDGGDDEAGCVARMRGVGRGARTFDHAWARAVRDQCREAGTAFFFKQGGASNRCQHSANGGCWDCIPADLRVREMPSR
jgi:hypothetical protein